MANTFDPTAAQQPAQATDAVCTMTAPTNGSGWKLSWITWSYSAAPTGGQLIIAWTDAAGAHSEAYGIALAGPGILQWNTPRRFPPNVGVVITIKSGAGTVVGAVFVGAETGF